MRSVQYAHCELVSFLVETFDEVRFVEKLGCFFFFPLGSEPVSA